MTEERYYSTLSKTESDIMPYLVGKDVGDGDEIFYKLDGIVELLNKKEKQIDELECSENFLKNLRQYYMKVIQLADALIRAKGSEEMIQIWDKEKYEIYFKWRKENG